MKKVSPLKEEVKRWIHVAMNNISFFQKELEKEKKQTNFMEIGISFLNLGYIQFLKGESFSIVKDSFRIGVENIRTSFSMFYELDSIGWREIPLEYVMNAIYASLLIGDFKLGKAFVKLVKIGSNEIKVITDKGSNEIIFSNYINAIKYIILGDSQKSLYFVKANEQWFIEREMNNGINLEVQRKFSFCSQLVNSILEQEAKWFKYCMEMLLKIYENDVRHGRLMNSLKRFFYMEGVALCNLAFYSGLKITIKNNRIPNDFLLF